MKTTNLFTKTALAALCLGTAITCFAQGKNLAKGTAEGLFKAPRTAQGTIQRFVFPQSSVRNIRAGIAAGKLERQVLPAANSLLPKAAKVQGSTFQNTRLTAEFPIEKEVLVKLLQEEKFYAPEIDAGRAIREQILNIHVLTDEGQIQLAQAIHSGIVNHTLKANLLQNLENFDIYNMALDLTDYFSLDKPFEESAFDYTLRHPHQMNLNLRRLMYNPLVDDGVKNRLKYFLEAPELVPAEHDAFRTAIRTAHLQYVERKNAAQLSQVIQTQVAYYKDLAARLDKFIVLHNGRQPKWNTKDLHEQNLFNEFEELTRNDFVNQFHPIIPLRRQLQVIWDTAKGPTLLSMQDTIKLFEEFVKTTHRRYPAPLMQPLDPGEIPFGEEELLWDSLNFWRVHNEAAIHPELVRIINQYPVY